MPEKMVFRTQLQVDASPVLKREIKKIALREGKNLKEVVLGALAQSYTELRPYVKSELEGIGQTRR